MARFLKLSLDVNAKVRVNFDMVFTYGDNVHGGTQIEFAHPGNDDDDMFLLVTETPEEIDRLLKGE